MRLRSLVCFVRMSFSASPCESVTRSLIMSLIDEFDRIYGAEL